MIFKKKYVGLVFVLLAIQLFFGCAGTSSMKFKSRIQSMPDDDLINYYHGIEARLKDVQASNRENDRLFKKSHDQFSINIKSEFYLGGAGQDLIHKRRIVIRELERRNIFPIHLK